VDVSSRYKAAILEAYPESFNAFLFWKARVGLYATLKAIGLGPGDEVILPGFTCVVVPNAILYLGAKPVYVDIERETFNTSLEQIQAAHSPKTKAVLIQNTFGLSSQVSEIATWAKEQGLVSIEDCTHGYGGFYNGKPNGSFCDLAFFSTQWSKPFSTGLGGFVLTSSKDISEKLSLLSEQLIKPTWFKSFSLGAQIWARQHLMGPASYWPLLKFYRFLSRNNIVSGSSGGEELEGIKMPKDYFMASSKLQAKHGLKALNSLDSQLAQRKSSAKAYSEFLKENGKNFVSEFLFENHSFLRYPLLVHNRDEFMRKAEAARLEVGDWFVSPLHPVKADLSEWQYEYGSCPIAETVASKIVNLSSSNHNETIDFLSRNLDLIE